MLKTASAAEGLAQRPGHQRARHHQAARRHRAGRTGQLAQRRQSDRRQTQLYLKSPVAGAEKRRPEYVFPTPALSSPLATMRYHVVTVLTHPPLGDLRMKTRTLTYLALGSSQRGRSRHRRVPPTLKNPSPSSCPLQPAAPPTRWRATLPRPCASHWVAPRWWLKTWAALAELCGRRQSGQGVPRRLHPCCFTTSAWPRRWACTRKLSYNTLAKTLNTPA